jgi:carbonic anhydrase
MFDLIYRCDPTDTDSHQVPLTSEQVRQLLVQGNRDFVELTDTRCGDHRTGIIRIDPRAFGWGITEGNAPPQAPFAAVLGCADARVPTEMVFTKGCNELFVVRVAGNVLGQECLGSLRYAVHHFSATLKLLVVLAHSSCGAVTEAVDVYLEPRRYMQIAADSSLRSILDQILVAIRAAAMTMEALYGPEILRKTDARASLLEAAVALNAAWSAYCLHEEFCPKFPDIRVVFGVYDLISRRIRLPLSTSGQRTDEETGLFSPPENVDEFRELARRICSSKLVRSLVQGAYQAA